jgi:hypothetical protein
MAMRLHETDYAGLTGINSPPYKRDINWNPYGRSDPYVALVFWSGAMIAISGYERFELVSSLYGPGNLACWLFLLISVLVSWTMNPSCSRKDTITNDFIAVLTLPVVAVAHFFHQVVHQTGGSNGKRLGLRDFFTSPNRDDVKAVAAIEGPLTVCEDFIMWASLLYLLAARKGQRKRMSLVIGTGSLCLSVELLLLSSWVPFEASFFIRPFFFHLTPFLIIISCWNILMVLVYLLQLISGVLLVLKKPSQPEVESGQTLIRQIFRLGRFSSWMAGSSAVIAFIGSFWIKYVWIYPSQTSNSFRFVPRSTSKFSDLDQIVAGIGGAVALLFSLLDAYKEWKKVKSKARISGNNLELYPFH